MGSRKVFGSWKTWGVALGATAALTLGPLAATAASADTLPVSPGSVTGPVTSAISGLPVVGGIVSTVTDTVSGAGGNLPTGSLPALPTGGLPSLPTSGLPSLPTGGLPSLPISADPSTLPVVGSIVSTVTGALPIPAGLPVGSLPTGLPSLPVSLPSLPIGLPGLPTGTVPGLQSIPVIGNLLGPLSLPVGSTGTQSSPDPSGSSDFGNGGGVLDISSSPSGFGIPATSAGSGALAFTGEPAWIRLLGLVAMAAAIAVALAAGLLRLASRCLG